MTLSLKESMSLVTGLMARPCQTSFRSKLNRRVMVKLSKKAKLKRKEKRSKLVKRQQVSLSRKKKEQRERCPCP